MTQHSIVVAESMLELFKRGVTAFDVHAHIVCLDQFFDRVGQLTATPVLKAVNRAFLAGDERLIALDHGRNLFALVRVNNENYFVMTHRSSFWMTCLKSKG